MQYARITLDVAVEDYGVRTQDGALNAVLEALNDQIEIHVLEYDSEPMALTPIAEPGQ